MTFRVGITLWVTCGLSAFVIARIVPLGRRRLWPWELGLALLVAAAFGVVATFFDFAGWGEPDWRAGLFIFLGALAAIGAFRLVPFSPADLSEHGRRR